MSTAGHTFSMRSNVRFSEEVEHQTSNKKRLLDNKLDSLLFTQPDFTLAEILDMLQALRIKHGLTQVVIDDFFKLIKLLAGPDFEDFSVSKYLMKKNNAPSKNVKFYSFYCNPCKKLLNILRTPEDLKNLETSQCSKCKKNVDLKKKDKKLIS